MRLRRVLALTAALFALSPIMATAASAAVAGPGLPPLGDSCAMQEWLGIQNVRACEDGW